MRQFKDKNGQDWTIDLPIGTVLRVKSISEARFNLLEPTGLCDKLVQDDGEFWELLWHLVSPQAAERSIDAEKFGLLMAAECLAHARRLFFEAWADFFHQLHRPDKAAAVEKMALYLAKAIELTTEKLKSPEMQKLDQKVEAKMRSTLNNSFGELLDSLESTPARSPGKC
jgi:hypothetical protein